MTFTGAETSPTLLSERSVSALVGLSLLYRMVYAGRLFSVTQEVLVLLGAFAVLAESVLVLVLVLVLMALAGLVWVVLALLAQLTAELADDDGEPSDSDRVW